jgi:starch synthase
MVLVSTGTGFRPFRVLQVAAEVTPFAKTGGLGDVVAGLSRYLGRAGHDVRIFLPAYAHLSAERDLFTPVEFIQNVPIQLGPNRLIFSLYTRKLPESEVDAYFVDCPALFRREGIYQGDWEDSLRFTLLVRAAYESAQRMGWAPDVVHCHDWHTALAPLVRKAVYGWDQLFARTRSLLTIHNMSYQGHVSAGRLTDLGLAEHSWAFDRRDLAEGRVNFLKTGLYHADLLTAVSETYAREIQTPEFGYGLEGILRSRGEGLVGVVNGVDYGEWSPDIDPHLPAHYSLDDLAGKTEIKRRLLGEIGMDAQHGGPVLGLVSRLTAQKGFDLGFDVLPWFLAHRDVRLVALGSGEPRYEEYFTWLQRTFPGKVWYYRGFRNDLAHWIEAGSDLFLMPSKFEPCGLNQMYSLKYGTPPIVHRTGGLADTVQLFDAAKGTGTGFVFDHFVPDGLGWALDYALKTYPQREAWAQLQHNGMERDFSWDVQGPRYLELYGRLAG